jgi:hypothetical protein
MHRETTRIEYDRSSATHAYSNLSTPLRPAQSFRVDDSDRQSLRVSIHATSAADSQPALLNQDLTSPLSRYPLL